MIVIDTSALVAIMFDEPEAVAFGKKIIASETKRISAANFVEASIVIEKRHRDTGKRDLDHFILRSKIEVASVDPRQAEMARDAYRVFGKGQHPANLNFGDCFAYALSKITGYPLLYKCNDFSQTDIVSAL